MTYRDFSLPGIVPWGRSAAEYEAFFGLSDVSADARVLDCAAGPASFAAEWSRRGRFVIAIDPMYDRPAIELLSAFPETAGKMLAGMRTAHARFNWEYYKTPEQVIDRRRQALLAFAEDRQRAGSAGRYVAGALPHLPLPSDSFDVVLCAHFLFLYSAELDMEMHLASLREMLRVGREVRVFPLLDMDGERSRHVDRAVEELRQEAEVELVRVPFEFRRGDFRMLRMNEGARRRVES